jgi:pimeloyl-ACP methyl ester carboxylesterase
VAERYALQYPTRVARIVLDSVVPQTGVDPRYRAALSATGRVLRSVCAADHCEWDPSADLSGVVDRLHDGPAVLDALLSGERDLSTPLAWARQEAARAPDGQLLEVPDAGHSVQLRARDPDVRRTVERFLATG